jgi:hypothetical protein
MGTKSLSSSLSFNRLEDKRTEIPFLSMDGEFRWKINEPAFKR